MVSESEQTVPMNNKLAKKGSERLQMADEFGEMVSTEVKEEGDR